MAVFDLEKASAMLSQGNTGVIDAIGMGFGVPNCMLELTKSALSILPASVLGDMSQSLQEGRDSANQSFANAVKGIFLNSGIIEFDTETGKLRLVSSSSKHGIDKNENQAIKGMEAISKALAYGSTLWANGQSVATQIGEVSECFNTFLDSQKYSSGNSARYVAGVDFDENDLPTESNFAANLAELNGALEFIKGSSKVITDINSIMFERTIGSTEEPIFYDAIDLSGLFPTIASGSPIQIQDGSEFFDLVFGPPKSKSGKFLLTTDGYYYPYTSALTVDVSNIHAGSIPAKSSLWTLQHDPNLGGKGQEISLESINNYFDTIFDDSKIDNTKSMQSWYDNDHFLNVIISQKDKNIYDLSGQLIQALNVSGEVEGSAFIVNLKQAIYGTLAAHLVKINKRKKQIEIAVKAPALFGKPPVFTLGSIPINDFSYLADINVPLSLTTQKKLAFKHGEVSGIVLPIKPKFVVGKEITDNINLNHLLLPPIGRGSIINSSSSLTVSSANMLSLTEDIVSDNLIAVYNFLESRVVNRTDSDSFRVLNCAVDNLYGNAQLVALTASDVFTSGLGVPYLKGVGGYNPVNGNPSSIGSFIKLPSIPEFRDLGYSNDGFSFDFWTYIPDLESNWGSENASSLHKIILACENTGGTLTVDDPNKVGPNIGFESVRGFVMGFTRDRQIVSGLEPMNTLLTNPTSGMAFYIAPTQSVNGNDITFINSTKNINNCIDEINYHKMSIGVCSVVGGLRYYNAGCDFIHVVVAANPKTNEVKMYLDSVLMSTSALSDVFGVEPFTSPQFPSFHSPNSFRYNSYSGLTNTVMAAGPKVDSYFTPWIIGGGYTDGLINDGGFMGLNSGRTSGLKGHIGSFKFYSKALDNTEVRKNFLAQRLFFKNISTPGCGIAFAEGEIDFTGTPLSGLLPLPVAFQGSSTYV